MYTLTQLSWYKPIFMTELIIAEALFSAKLSKRKGFWLRVILALIFLYVVSVAIPVVSYDAVWCSLMFVFLYASSLIALVFCFEEPFFNLLFCSIAGYTVQHVAFQSYGILCVLFGIDSNNDVYSGMANDTGYAPFTKPQTMLLYMVTFVIAYWIYYVVFARRIKGEKELLLKSNNMMVFVAVMIIVDIVVSAFVTYYSYEHEDEFYTTMLSVFGVMLCTVLLTYQFELPERRNAEKELSIVYDLLDKERKQYEAVKSNIDLVNRRCHDLKYHIREIGDKAKIDNETLEEIGREISIYDAAIKTGNEALDTILTEKSLYCCNNGINLSCIADGKSLSFMKDADIYVLFGNAIDNAIEAVKKVEPDKRGIGITIKRINGFVFVNIHNYFSEEIVFDGEIIKTTKANKSAHGHGIASMRAICSKYDGDMSIKVENNVFNLKLCFVRND